MSTLASFFFTSAATTELYTYYHTLSLHGALPILLSWPQSTKAFSSATSDETPKCATAPSAPLFVTYPLPRPRNGKTRPRAKSAKKPNGTVWCSRSEEHTSEPQ